MQRYPLYPDRPVIQRGLIIPGWFVSLPNGELVARETFEGALRVVDEYHRIVKEVESWR